MRKSTIFFLLILAMLLDTFCESSKKVPLIFEVSVIDSITCRAYLENNFYDNIVIPYANYSRDSIPLIKPRDISYYSASNDSLIYSNSIFLTHKTGELIIKKNSKSTFLMDINPASKLDEYTINFYSIMIDSAGYRCQYALYTYFPLYRGYGIKKNETDPCWHSTQPK